MIFITKKAFEDEIMNRMREIHFRDETDRKLMELDRRVCDLEWRVKCIEDPPPTVGVPTDLEVASVTKNP